jgi:hypothetical protein
MSGSNWVGGTYGFTAFLLGLNGVIDSKSPFDAVGVKSLLLEEPLAAYL